MQAVISTLAIAALFNPLRRRIQELIDRRFYRRSYDSEQTLALFSAAARNEVDLNRLVGVMVAVIQASIQPDHVTVSLRTAGEEKRL